MSDWIARRCHVSGRVQGGFYLPDGGVEVLACGDPAAVDTLLRWLWQGSPASHVTAVDVSEVPTAELGPRPGAFRTG